MKKLTFNSVKEQLRLVRCKISKTTVEGEYRVVLTENSRKKEFGYYTDDLLDALQTGKAMRERVERGITV